MEQTLWTYRDPAPSKTFDTKGIKRLITDYLNGPVERPLMIWCHNNPSIDQLREYLAEYRREDSAKLFELGSIGRYSSDKYVLDGDKVKHLRGDCSKYPDIAFLPYSTYGKIFGFFYFNTGFVSDQFGEDFSRALGLSCHYRIPSVFLVNDYAAFKVKDQIPRHFFDHVRYLPTVREFIDDARQYLEKGTMDEPGRYVYSGVIDMAEGFIGDDDYAYYFDKLIDAVFEIIENGVDGSDLGLSATYKEGPVAVTKTMGVGRMGLGGKLKEDDPESYFLKKFHAALLASELAWMFDSSKPIPAEIAGFVGKGDE